MTEIKSEHAEVLNALADGVPKRTRDIFPLTTEIADTAALSKIINYLAKTKFWIEPSKDDPKAYQLTELGQEALDAHHGKRAEPKQSASADGEADRAGESEQLPAEPEIPSLEKYMATQSTAQDEPECHALDPECPIDAALLNLSATIKREVLQANKITITDKSKKLKTIEFLNDNHILGNEFLEVLMDIHADIERLSEVE